LSKKSDMSGLVDVNVAIKTIRRLRLLITCCLRTARFKLLIPIPDLLESNGVLALDSSDTGLGTGFLI